MAGTPRDITYLETKFETGDIPTQQDFYDLFASFVHYLKIAQVIGEDTAKVMSQKAVSDFLATCWVDRGFWNITTGLLPTSNVKKNNTWDVILDDPEGAPVAFGSILIPHGSILRAMEDGADDITKFKVIRPS